MSAEEWRIVALGDRIALLESKLKLAADEGTGGLHRHFAGVASDTRCDKCGCPTPAGGEDGSTYGFTYSDHYTGCSKMAEGGTLFVGQEDEERDG